MRKIIIIIDKYPNGSFNSSQNNLCVIARRCTVIVLQKIKERRARPALFTTLKTKSI